MKDIIFGTRQIGGPPSYTPCEDATAQKVLEYAYKKGIRIFDTAPIYGLGKSEELLGRTLESERKNFKIITKFGFDWDESKNTFFDFSSDGIQRQLEKSLHRLKTNFIDIYLLHIPVTQLNTEQILTTLNQLKMSGVIKSYGVCNMYSQQLAGFLHHPLSQLEYVEDFYNILERKAENLTFPYLNTAHKFLAYGALYRGVMTGQSLQDLLKKNEDGINRLIKNPNIKKLYTQKHLYQAVANKKNISLEQLALEFLLQHQRVDGILFGTKNTEHLDIFLEIIEHLETQ